MPDLQKKFNLIGLTIQSYVSYRRHNLYYPSIPWLPAHVHSFLIARLADKAACCACSREKRTFVCLAHHIKQERAHRMDDVRTRSLIMSGQRLRELSWVDN